MNPILKVVLKLSEFFRHYSTRVSLKIQKRDREQLVRFVEFRFKGLSKYMLNLGYSAGAFRRVYNTWVNYLREQLSPSDFANFIHGTFHDQLHETIASNSNQPGQDDPYGIHLGAGFEDLLSTFNKGEYDFHATSPQVSVIYPVQNRDATRLLLSALSLKLSSKIPFEVVFVDYGSSASFLKKHQDLAAKHGITYIQVYSEGLPWSRGHALNIGVSKAKAEFVVTTDIDMVFDSDILAESLALQPHKKAIHCRPLWLAQNGDKTNAWLGDNNQLGGFQFLRKQDFIDLGGFNTAIKYWGIEDIEFSQRQLTAGWEKLWIEQSMYHMWHPHDYGDLSMRPESSWFDSELALMQNQKLEPLPDADDLLHISNRPILGEFKDEAKIHKIEVQSYDNEFQQILKDSAENKKIRLQLGPRMNPDIKSYYGEIRSFASAFNRYNVQTLPVKNKNFDYFYLSLPLLKKHGLVDYFIHPDYDVVDLLFK